MSNNKHDLRDWDLTVDLPGIGKSQHSVYAPSLSAAKTLLQSQLKQRGWHINHSQIFPTPPPNDPRPAP